MKMFILLLISVVIPLNYCASTRIPSGNYSLSQELTTVSSLIFDVIQDKEKYEIHRGIYFSLLNEEFKYHKNRSNSLNLHLHRNDIKPYATAIKFLKSLTDLSKEGKEWFQQVSDKAVRKRNVDGTNNKNNISKRKQKKAKMLGRLLMNNALSKNYEDIQDDYMDNEDDYLLNVNRKKMKWEDFRNEDGASVMELIALNARHKTNMRRA